MLPFQKTPAYCVAAEGLCWACCTLLASWPTLRCATRPSPACAPSMPPRFRPCSSSWNDLAPILEPSRSSSPPSPRCWGPPGQANYAAANSLLDFSAFAAQRRGFVSTSVQWSAWSGAGMASNDASTKARVERTGLGMVGAGAGLAAMSGLLRQRPATAPSALAAVPFRWDRFIQNKYRGQAPPMFEEFAVAAAAVTVPAAAPQPGAASGAVAAVPGVNHEQYILGVINESVRSVLGADVDPSQPLMAAGLDSLSAVEFRNGLESRVGVELPSTLVFDYPTVDAMAAFLAKKVAPAAAVGATAGATVADFGYVPEAVALSEASGRVSNDVAVLSGMTVRSPAQAMASIYPTDASALIPLSRWDVDAHADLYGGLPVRFGPTLGVIDRFDAAAVGVPEAEAALMDPQQRLLLELTAELLLEGGKSCVISAMGAFIGLSSTDYAKVSPFESTAFDLSTSLTFSFFHSGHGQACARSDCIHRHWKHP